MILRKIYKISDELIKEAWIYAIISKKFTSNRHDFHEGGLDAKQRKMFEGKLGEKIFKMFLIENNINFEEDKTSHKDPDSYDFILPDKSTIDIKTRTQEFHTRTLEMVEQFRKKPKDIYISVRLYPDRKEGVLLGWFSKKDLLIINRIENNGYLDNYVLYDEELKSIQELFDKIKIFKKEK